MTAQPEIETRQLVSVRAAAASLNFHPRGTIRCNGVPLFRNQLARDLGCLLDVDRDVISWSCLPMALSVRHAVHIPDFLVNRADGQVMVDAVSTPSDCASALVEVAASREGHGYEAMSSQQIYSGFRLVNAIDLLRYARWHCPLGDRVRTLAALDEQGALTVTECLTAFHETVPIAGLAALILGRFVEIDFDEARIGPETLVRRCRD